MRNAQTWYKVLFLLNHALTIKVNRIMNNYIRQCKCRCGLGSLLGQSRLIQKKWTCKSWPILNWCTSVNWRIGRKTARNRKKENKIRELVKETIYVRFVIVWSLSSLSKNVGMFLEQKASKRCRLCGSYTWQNVWSRKWPNWESKVLLTR